MKILCRTIGAFAGDESGSPAMEYSLIAAVIAMVLIGAFGIAGGGLNGLFTSMSNTAGDTLSNSSSVL